MVFIPVKMTKLSKNKVLVPLRHLSSVLLSVSLTFCLSVPRPTLMFLWTVILVVTFSVILNLVLLKAKVMFSINLF